MFRFHRERVIGHFFQISIAVQRLAALTVFWFVLAPGAESPPEKPTVSLGAESDFVYQYLWRGISYNRGLLAQPSAWFSRGNLSISTWCNLTLLDVDGTVKQHEIDLTAQYDLSAGDFCISPSVNLYLYPNETHAPTTGELALFIGYRQNNWEFSTSHYLDYLEYRGALYSEIGTTYALKELTMGLNVGGASPKFNRAYNGLSISTLSNLSLTCDYELELPGKIIIRPHIEYFINLDSDLQRINRANLLNIGLAFIIGA